MEPGQVSYDTFGQWLLTRLQADLAVCEIKPVPDLVRFFTSLYGDMLAQPESYFIPDEPFVTFFSRALFTPEETAQHEALKAARMRVRKVVLAYLEFFYKLGRAGMVVAAPKVGELQVSRDAFEKLAAEGMKKAKTRQFLNVLERNGLTFSPGDPVVISHSSLPDMPAALAEFSQACARVKDFDFYLFRRCDLAVFDGKTMPDLHDALHIAPQPYQGDVAETDERLRQLRFKRVIFADDGDMNYRVRYSKKGDQLVYWCRIQETFQPDLIHYLRWKLDSELTPRLFARLEEMTPGLADQVFAGIKQCAHCYAGNCMDRKYIQWQDTTKEVCQGDCWNRIGFSRADYERLWLVLTTLNSLVAG